MAWGLSLASVLGVGSAGAEELFTLVVSGASGEVAYAERLDQWRQDLVAALRAQPGFRDDHLVVLAETPGAGVGRASRDGVRQAVETLSLRATDASTLLVVLLGHGTDDGVEARFNLVGPDLTAGEWADLLGTLPGRLVVVNTTAASFAFLEALTGPDRVVITATSSGLQRYDTVFPEFFVAALADATADADRDGRASVWEAFTFASAGVRRWYQGQGRLATEHALLDDTGDGRGRRHDQDGTDGLLAEHLHVGAGVGPPPLHTDPALQPLVEARRELEEAVLEWRRGRDGVGEAEYRRELERLLIELARVSREIRRRVTPS